MSQQRILVVEEDDLVRAFIARTLRGAGFLIQAFPSGSDGLRHLKETQEPLALMVVDRRWAKWQRA